MPIFFRVLLLVLSIFYLNSFNLNSQNLKSEKIWILEESNLTRVPQDYFEYYEDSEYDLTVDELETADWRKELLTNQSYYEGFWVKIAVLNKTNTEILGIQHNWNFEKKLMYKNSERTVEYPFLDSEYNNYKHIDENRIWFDYKILMPKNEITYVYSYFRSQPLDRIMVRKGSLDRLSVGPWEEIKLKQIYRTTSFFVYIAVLFFFSMYFILYFFISKEISYFWIASLFISLIYPGVAFLLSTIYGIRFNYMLGPLGYSFVCIIIIQFFRKILILSNTYPNIDRIFLIVNVLYLIFSAFYIYDVFQYPDSEYFTNLIKHPYSYLGPGTIPIYLSFIPMGGIALTAITIAFILMREGDPSAKYLLITFLVPILAVLVRLIISITNIENSDSEFKYVFNALPPFLLLFMPVTIGLALAERVNQFKKNAIDLLETTVEQRTSDLRKTSEDLIAANNDMNKSIQAASAIQNAILPKIDSAHYGFNDLRYVWEPRDTIGGDFYWLDNKNGWTCLVLADCTGHGIPGAFMTLISSTLLDRISSIKDLSQPGDILNDLDEFLQKSLSLDQNHKQTDFGLDAGVCCFSNEERIFRYSGAKMNLYQKLNQDVVEFKGDKKSLGYDIKEHPLDFKVYEFDLDQQSSFFFFSDGVTDQIGGEKKLMYGKKRVINQIRAAADVPSAVNNIVADIKRYQGVNKRRDDLTLFGFSV